MDKHIVDLFSAVSQIDRRYFYSIGTRPNQEQYYQSIELSFAAELYHRYKTIIELPVNRSYYQDLILHFDINKEAVNSRPDIVLHEAQENRNNQKMYIEVKTDPYSNLESDFQKLIIAIDDYLQFSSAIIIIVNRSFITVKNQISTYFRNLDYDKKEKLFLINLEIVNNNIEYNLYPFSSIRYSL